MARLLVRLILKFGFLIIFYFSCIIITKGVIYEKYVKSIVFI